MTSLWISKTSHTVQYTLLLRYCCTLQVNLQNSEWLCKIQARSKCSVVSIFKVGYTYHKSQHASGTGRHCLKMKMKIPEGLPLHCSFFFFLILLLFWREIFHIFLQISFQHLYRWTRKRIKEIEIKNIFEYQFQNNKNAK